MAFVTQHFDQLCFTSHGSCRTLFLHHHHHHLAADSLICCVVCFAAGTKAAAVTESAQAHSGGSTGAGSRMFGSPQRSLKGAACCDKFVLEQTVLVTSFSGISMPQHKVLSVMLMQSMSGHCFIPTSSLVLSMQPCSCVCQTS